VSNFGQLRDAPEPYDPFSIISFVRKFPGDGNPMVKKILLLVVLALALPLAAFASSSIDIGNAGGVVSGNSSGLSLTGSTLFKLGGIVGSNLGSVNFTTGAFMSGDAQMGGVLTPSSSFQIVGNGTSGVPNGAIFSGTFSSAK
jgi:hypothetical protein